MSRFFATASRGIESVLAEELSSLGIAQVEERRGGVAFGAKLDDAYRACLWSRIASRVLAPLTAFEASDADALYTGVHAVDWNEHLGSRTTLAVDVAGARSPAGPGHFLALKAKDAIVDRIRERCGRRPDVDTADPDLRINLHVRGPQVTVHLDLAGRGLHRRGIGRAGAEAPLKENLAAAILWTAGWPQRCAEAPLFDPLCGSGTLLVEAAWMALDVAPGLSRERLGAEGWLGHDAALWRDLRREALERREAARGREVRIAGSDAAPATLAAARSNLRRAALPGVVRLERRELADVEPPWDDPGLVVTNPPYGERLGEAAELGPLYELLGDVLKRRFPGWHAWVLTGNPALGRRIGLRPAARRVLYNGPLECRLLEIPIAGAPVGQGGPGWRRPGAEARAFAGRLGKNLTERRRRAAGEGLTCYRVYDADMPEYNLSVDWYDGAVRVEEYAPPRKIRAADAERHLREALHVVPEVLGVDPAQVVLRVRERRSAGRQHGRRDDRRRFREVREGDLRFLVNLTDYLDTGLFLDDRLLRRRVAARARDVDFLNLFAYTCTASVAAARGGARSTTSVDLSNVYLDWGKRNFRANGLDLERHRFVRADVSRWLVERRGSRNYGLIFLAPPTYSKSRATSGDFDVQRDHVRLLSAAARILTPDGRIVFSTNLRRFELDEAGLSRWAVREISAEMTPFDFERRPRLRAWLVGRR